MGVTERVARFVADLDYKRVPPVAVEKIKASLLDTLGTALVGTRAPQCVIMTGFIKKNCGRSDQARLIGSGYRTTACDAALAMFASAARLSNACGREEWS